MSVVDGKRRAISEEEIGGAGVEAEPNRAGMDWMRVDIGSSWS